LLQLGVPYDAACKLPLPVALAMLSDERLDNPRPTSSQPPAAPPAPKLLPTNGVRYVATKRKCKPKDKP